MKRNARVGQKWNLNLTERKRADDNNYEEIDQERKKNYDESDENKQKN